MLTICFAIAFRLICASEAVSEESSHLSISLDCDGEKCDILEEAEIYNILTENPESSALLFENLKIPRIPQMFFEAYPKLRELSLGNSSVMKIEQYDFDQADNLKVLNLSDNFITQIQNETFLFTPNLQYMWLDRNQIQSLHEQSFQDLKELMILSLSDNLIEVLPRGVFDGLEKLQVISLSFNRIEVIPADLFLNNMKIYGIDMHHNKLKDIGLSTFTKLQKIQLLDMSYNPTLSKVILEVNFPGKLVLNRCGLEKLSIYGKFTDGDFKDNLLREIYFENPQTIEKLDLRNNSLKDLETFSGRMDRLKYLDLSVNPLGKLQTRHFAGMNSLVSLNISSTNLTTLNGDLFKRSDLKILDISDNKIEDFNLTLANNLKSMRNFYLDRNSWNCYSLKLVMDLFLDSREIAYSIDSFDDEFPGKYIHGIACLNKSNENEKAELLAKEYSVVAYEDPSEVSRKEYDDLEEEIQSLKSKMQAITAFYEQKFNKFSKRIQVLEERLEGKDDISPWSSNLYVNESSPKTIDTL